jgi:hypothetical protein
MGADPGMVRWPAWSGTRVFRTARITARAFRDPNGPNRVGLIVEIPDFAAFEQLTRLCRDQVVRPRCRRIRSAA